MSYDSQNIFAKILRGEIPCIPLFENEYVLAFPDINPKAKVHILIIPKGAYVSFDDFMGQGTSKEISSFWAAIPEIAQQQAIKDSGYRLISNHGKNAHQEVPHFHVHLLGGEDLKGF